MKLARKLVWLMTYNARQSYGEDAIKSIRVTPQQHNTYPPPMAHAWGKYWDVKGSLGEAFECLFIVRYKGTQERQFTILSRNSDIAS